MSDWFQNLRSIVGRHEPAADAHALPRAAAALMIELASTEEGSDRVELAVVHQAMQRTFGLAEDELAELVDQAHQASRASVSLHEFTRELRTGLDAAQRAELVEWLWRVAYADTRLHMDEEHLIRRIADLLAVPHQEFIRRKLLAREA